MRLLRTHQLLILHMHESVSQRFAPEFARTCPARNSSTCCQETRSLEFLLPATQCVRGVPCTVFPAKTCAITRCLQSAAPEKTTVAITETYARYLPARGSGARGALTHRVWRGKTARDDCRRVKRLSSLSFSVRTGGKGTIEDASHSLFAVGVPVLPGCVTTDENFEAHFDRSFLYGEVD